jgi:hypothetical protein
MADATPEALFGSESVRTAPRALLYWLVLDMQGKNAISAHVNQLEAG